MATRSTFLKTRCAGYFNREIPEEDAEPTRVGPGSPAADMEMMHRIGRELAQSYLAQPPLLAGR